MAVPTSRPGDRQGESGITPRKCARSVGRRGALSLNTGSMTDKDPLRRLLDAVLETEGSSLEEMAAGARMSPFHFHRTVRSRAGETPAAIRRRVRLEQAAWRLQGGDSVTDAAFGAGYDSVEGFSRAFRRAYGCAPSELPPRAERGHWLPAPNGLHFHSPTTLYVAAGGSREDPSGTSSPSSSSTTSTTSRCWWRPRPH